MSIRRKGWQLPLKTDQTRTNQTTRCLRPTVWRQRTSNLHQCLLGCHEKDVQNPALLLSLRCPCQGRAAQKEVRPPTPPGRRAKVYHPCKHTMKLKTKLSVQYPLPSPSKSRQRAGRREWWPRPKTWCLSWRMFLSLWPQTRPRLRMAWTITPTFLTLVTHLHPCQRRNHSLRQDPLHRPQPKELLHLPQRRSHPLYQWLQQ